MKKVPNGSQQSFLTGTSHLTCKQLYSCCIGMESLIARLVERAQNKAVSQHAASVSFAEPVEENPSATVDALGSTADQQDEISNLFIDILSGHSAIPIRVKIILDKIVEILDYGKLELICLNSQWTCEDYGRGYKTKYNGIMSNSFTMIDEQEAVDRLSAFIIRSPSAQSIFTQGYAPPLCSMKKFPDLPIATDPLSTVISVKLNGNPGLDLNPDTDVNSFMDNKPNEDCESNSIHDMLVRLGVAPALMKTETTSPAKKEVAGDFTDSDVVSLAHILKKSKRVSCEECGKSFCDRGALKTHRSAVHLKQMHTCNVPGCGKQFNSTRSRDRHSANPNQKLHIPDPASFRDSQLFPSQVIATRLPSNEAGMPILSPIGFSSSLVKRELVDAETEDNKFDIPLLKKRLAEFDRYDEKRASKCEMPSSPTVPVLSPIMPQAALDLRTVLLQQLAQANASMFSSLL